MKGINISGLRVDSTGRSVLADDALALIETSFVPTAAAGENSSTCSGTNSGCTNSGDCTASTNNQTCTNSNNCRVGGDDTLPYP